MKFKVVLGIKDSTGQKIRKYRIIDEQGNIRDISISKIKEVLSKGITIEDLQITNGNIVETVEIPKISELKESSISLYDWCTQNGERGQRILTEFDNADNFPIFAKDIAVSSHKKAKFKCSVCNKINSQAVSNKTGKIERGCKYCSGYEVSDKNSLLSWCNTHGDYGAQILQEFIAGDNEFTPDQVAYASTKYANFKCSTCGNINKQIISSKTSKKIKGCRHCDKTKTSFGEQLIYMWLQSQGFEVYNQYKIQTSIGTKEFDIYIPQLNLVIEHQSNRHATPERQFNDDTTELIAQQLGINLLEICLLHLNYIREENNWCITYKLNHETEMIKKISLWLNINYGLNTNPLYERALEDQAYVNSCKVKYEQSLAYHNPSFLKEWNYKLNGIVTPDKVALNSIRKYYWTCPICGHTYLA